jgi:dTDP-4-dehydrorhamnose reductase
VVGDLQRTAPVLEAWREQNDPERTRVVHAIAETHPDLVAITGDCVFDGASDAQWRAFDALASRSCGGEGAFQFETASVRTISRK